MEAERQRMELEAEKERLRLERLAEEERIKLLKLREQERLRKEAQIRELKRLKAVDELEKLN
jgi:hypothetical protein